ncbi:hypothetical protein ACVWZ6_001069 [Bradyrhizobium sp. GM6.1]
MVDTKTPGDKKLSVPSKTLSLKPRVETGTVRQSFSHGRSKQVVVEKRGKRRVDGSPEPQVAEVAKPAPAAAPKPAPARPAPPRNAGSGVVLRTLTEDERSARASALADAKVREVEERRHAEEEAQRRAVRESAERADREAAEARRKAEEERHRHEEEAKRKAETEAKKRFGEGEQPQSVARPATGTSAAPAARPGAPMARPGTTTTARPGTTTARPGTTTQRPGGPVGRAPAVAAGPDEDDGPRQIRRGPGGAARPVVAPKPTHKPGPQKERGRLTVVTALQCRRRPRALDRLVPPPHPAPEGPCRERAEGKAHPRGGHSGSDHHPGARQPHVGARGGNHPHADEAGRDPQDHRRDRCRHCAADRRGAWSHRQARCRVRR